MAKKKSKVEAFETPRSSEHFTRLHDTLITSKQYKQLSHAARTVYVLIKSQYKGNYNGNRIIYPYRQFQEYGMNTNTISRAVQELEAAGFIDIERQGFTTKNLHRQPTIYKLSSRWWKEEKKKEGC